MERRLLPTQTTTTAITTPVTLNVHKRSWDRSLGTAGEQLKTHCEQFGGEVRGVRTNRNGTTRPTPPIRREDLPPPSLST